MNNEETILDPQYMTEPSEKKETVETSNPTKKTRMGEKAAYAAGGAVFGAGATVAGQAVAAQPEEVVATVEETPKQEVQAETPKPEDSPAPEESIVATATGIRVAQVDDDDSFAEAFADARAQVGPGGVFEWHGRVYGTYYKDEWEQMTAEQRSQYQASIDYKDVISDESVAQHHNELAQQHAAQPIPSTDSSIHATAHEEDDVEVHVLEVGQTDLDGDGNFENAAVLDVNGHEVCIVDIDRDGTADALMAFNGRGELEVHDISDAGMAMPNMSDADIYMAQADSAPDYMNDANVGLYEA